MEENRKELTSKQLAVFAAKLVENVKKKIPSRSQQINVLKMATFFLSQTDETERSHG